MIDPHKLVHVRDNIFKQPYLYHGRPHNKYFVQ